MGWELVSRITCDYLCDDRGPRSDLIPNTNVHTEKDDDPDDLVTTDDLLWSENMALVQNAGGLSLRCLRAAVFHGGPIGILPRLGCITVQL